MAIRLTKEALECYILTCLSIQRMHTAQILKCVSIRIENIKTATFYNALTSLEEKGQIKKREVVKNGVTLEVYGITMAGQKHLDVLLNE